MDYVAGIKIDEVAQIRAAGLDPREVARIGLRSFSRQLLEFGFFHADPHPANTIVMPDGRVALVDFGITGYLDEETMGQVAAVFLGYSRRDYGLVIDALLDAGLIDEQTDLIALRADLKDMSEVFYGRTLATIQVKDVYDQVMDLAYRYGIRFPRNLLLLFKTLIQTEALGKILGSRDSLLEAVAPRARRLLGHGIKPRARIREELRHLAAILRNIVAGRQAFELRHTGFEGLDSKIEKGVNRLTVGLIIAASTIAAALILNSGREVLVLNLDFFGLPVISLTGLLGITGYSIATILGIWLIVSIVRAGRL
jgi:ubiquinone biosynthesis protein